MMDWDAPTPDEIDAWEKHDQQDAQYDREAVDADDEYPRDEPETM